MEGEGGQGVGRKGKMEKRREGKEKGKPNTIRKPLFGVCMCALTVYTHTHQKPEKIPSGYS